MLICCVSKNINESGQKRRRGDDYETATQSTTKAKKQVKTEEKAPEDAMQETVDKFSKITERDLSCGRSLGQYSMGLVNPHL